MSEIIDKSYQCYQAQFRRQQSLAKQGLSRPLKEGKSQELAGLIHLGFVGQEPQIAIPPSEVLFVQELA